MKFEGGDKMSSNNEDFWDFLGLGALALLGASAYYVYKKANSEAKKDEAIAEKIKNSENIKILEELPSISTDAINLGKRGYMLNSNNLSALELKGAPSDEVVDI